MRRILLSSVAATAIALSFTAAHAQPDASDRADKPAASTQRPSASEPVNGQSPKAERKGRGEGQSEPASRMSDTKRQPQTSGARDNDNRARTKGPSIEDKSTGRQEASDRKDKSERSKQQKSSGQGNDRSTQHERPSTTSESSQRAPQDSQHQRRQQDTNRDTSESKERSTSGNDRRSSHSDSSGGERSRDESASLSGEQRERVTTRFSANIEKLNVRPVSRTDISVSIGTAVPRSVRLYDVPRDVIEIYPRFRGDKFVVVEDEIVIIEPSSRKIVATLPRSGARTTTGKASGSDRIRLSSDQRRTIHTIIMREQSCHYEPRIDFTIGIPLPSAVQVCEFPQEVISDFPEIRRYRFVVHNDEVVIVDPSERRVVEIVD